MIAKRTAREDWECTSLTEVILPCSPRAYPFSCFPHVFRDVLACASFGLQGHISIGAYPDALMDFFNTSCAHAGRQDRHVCSRIASDMSSAEPCRMPVRPQAIKVKADTMLLLHIDLSMNVQHARQLLCE